MAMGWLRIRGGLFEERGRRVDADGSWILAGDCGEYVYGCGEIGRRLVVSLMGDGIALDMTGECTVEPGLDEVTEFVRLRRLLP